MFLFLYLLLDLLLLFQRCLQLPLLLQNCILCIFLYFLCLLFSFFLLLILLVTLLFSLKFPQDLIIRVPLVILFTISSLCFSLSLLVNQLLRLLLLCFLLKVFTTVVLLLPTLSSSCFLSHCCHFIVVPHSSSSHILLSLFLLLLRIVIFLQLFPENWILHEWWQSLSKHVCFIRHINIFTRLRSKGLLLSFSWMFNKIKNSTAPLQFLRVFHHWYAYEILFLSRTSS